MWPLRLRIKKTGGRALRAVSPHTDQASKAAFVPVPVQVPGIRPRGPSSNGYPAAPPRDPHPTRGACDQHEPQIFFAASAPSPLLSCCPRSRVPRPVPSRPGPRVVIGVAGGIARARAQYGAGGRRVSGPMGGGKVCAGGGGGGGGGVPGADGDGRNWNRWSDGRAGRAVPARGRRHRRQVCRGFVRKGRRGGAPSLSRCGGRGPPTRLQSGGRSAARAVCQTAKACSCSPVSCCVYRQGSGRRAVCTGRKNDRITKED